MVRTRLAYRLIFLVFLCFGLYLGAGCHKSPETPGDVKEKSLPMNKNSNLSSHGLLTGVSTSDAPAVKDSRSSPGFGPEELKALGLDDLVTIEHRSAKLSEEPNPLAGCLQCHVDIEKSHLDSKHYKVAKMDCVDCHGRSEPHVANENNDTKPDEIFARKEVNQLCGECHECSRDIPAGVTSIPREQRRVCTDCHSAHNFLIAYGKD